MQTKNKAVSAKSGAGTRKLHRLPGQDLAALKDFLSIAFHTIETEEQTQRRMFSDLMPQLYALRKRGRTYAELTKLLKQAGFKLQPSTVRAYYSEFISEKMALCEANFNDQLFVRDEIDKAIDNPSPNHIITTVIDIRNRQKQAADA